MEASGPHFAVGLGAGRIGARGAVCCAACCSIVVVVREGVKEGEKQRNEARWPLRDATCQSRPTFCHTGRRRPTCIRVTDGGEQSGVPGD